MTKIKVSPNAELRVIAILVMHGNYNSVPVKKAMLQLSDDCFLSNNNKKLFQIIKKQYDALNPFDMVKMMDLMLFQHQEVSEQFHNAIMQECHSTANFQAYIDELIHASQLRKQIHVGKVMLANCINAGSYQDSTDALNDGLKQIAEIQLNKSKEGSTLAEIGERYFDGHYQFETIPTNINFVDASLKGGIKNSCLLTICGDTGTGKTYFALYLMYKIGNCNPNKQSLYFNLEMAEQHNWERLIGIAAQKPFNLLSNQEKIATHSKLVQHPITIYEEKHNDIDDIITIARVKAMQMPLSVIVVDYISLVETKSSFGRSDLEQISVAKRLASLAIELNCIVIATSQTNRNPSNRNIDDRCPYMSDASDSSGNYKSAEIWLGIDRPELYNDNPFYKNKFIAKVRKNRNGLLFDTAWNFNAGTFEEIDSKHFFRLIANSHSHGEHAKVSFLKKDLAYLTRKDEY